jgi:hypothetical protein
MGLTPTYQLPYPETVDPVTVPVDMRELAEGIEAALGGKPLYASVETEEYFSSAAYVDLATVGPSLTLPVAGDYLLSWGVRFVAATTVGFFWYAALKFGAAAAVDADAVEFGGPASGAGTPWLASVARNRRYNGLAAGTVIKLQYRRVNADGGAAKRWLSAVLL